MSLMLMLLLKRSACGAEHDAIEGLHSSSLSTMVMSMTLTSIGFKATTPVDNAAVDTRLHQDVRDLHSALGQRKRQGVIKVCRALSVEDRSLY